MGKDKTGGKLNDGFSRINYLFQAAHLVLKETPHNLELVRHYVHTLRNVAKRKVLRLHPDIKRALCKKCCMLLVPGITSRTRKRGKKQKHMVVTCLECGTLKRFPTRDHYKLWIEQTEALAPEEKKQPKNVQQAKKSKRQTQLRSTEQTEQKGADMNELRTQQAMEENCDNFQEETTETVEKERNTKEDCTNEKH